MESTPIGQFCVALLNDQADYLLNLLATQDDEIARVIYDQIEQSQADAIERENLS